MQEILFPADILIIMSESRLTNALNRVMKLKDEKLPSLKATDVRTLIKSKEAQTMVLSAEMTLRGSLMRKETRESIFYREDYPTPDNKNWLKWIVVKKGRDGEMTFSTEDNSFERYPLKPELLRACGRDSPRRHRGFRWRNFLIQSREANPELNTVPAYSGGGPWRIEPTRLSGCLTQNCIVF